MLKYFIRFLLICLLYYSPYKSSGQESTAYTHPDKHFRKGIELFEKANFVSAQQHFNLAASNYSNKEIHQRGESEFYSALCAIELFNEDAEYLIRTFINKYPDNQKVNLAYFELGKLRYREKKYRDAIYWLNQADRSAFSKEQKAELLFKLGYSYFSCDEIDQASRAFFEIKDTKNKYSSPATYYYSHIAYTQNNYATALKGFEKLSNDETFSPLVPYYISQIYYLQKQYDKVVEYAPPILESATPKRAPEIARIIGESYYRLKQYEKAIPFIEKFVEGNQSLTREDNYLVGFVYYRNNRFEDAVKYLERVATEDDVLSQNANYHLADCYLKIDDKSKARHAFAMASNSDFDMSIKEDALFSFAKITYEMLYNPFNEAIEAFRRYIELFPQSPRIDEAHNYLVLAYSNTKNYKDALEALDKIKVKDASIKRAYQRVAFFRGLEFYQNLEFTKAKDAFTLSLNYPEYSQVINAQGLYWRGESFYRLEDYQNATTDYNLFVISPGSFSLPEYQMAHYNLGYSNFKLRNYDDAIVWFRKYTTIAQNKTDQILGDAYNRIGDSYFIQRQYWVALDYYEKAINTNTIDVDYALFQRGFAFGLVERPQKKIETLLALVDRFPESNYFDDALFELAETYLSLGQNQDAAKYYARIESEFPGSSYYVKSLVQLGISAYNNNDSENAMRYYKRVVEEFPGSQEAKNALVGLRNVYVDMGEVDKYFEYASNLGSLGNVTQAEKDSISYISSEKTYMSGDCQKTIQNFTKYLEEFPQGNFVLNANYYVGDCYYKNGELEKALNSFNYVIQRQKNPFTEQTLLAVSDIYMKTEKYAEAFEVFDMLESLADIKSNLLEARIGKLRSAAKLNQPQDVVEAAAKVLITEKLPQEIESEARYQRAHALLNLNRVDDAFDEFARIASNPSTAEGAESKYFMSKIYFEKGEFEKAEKEVFDFAGKNTPHQYWLAKSFILLADVYSKQDDFFQAKATLQSVLDGYSTTNDGIIDLASEKLSELIKAERLKQKGSEADTVHVKWSF